MMTKESLFFVVVGDISGTQKKTLQIITPKFAYTNSGWTQTRLTDILDLD
jgi:hypothetical protein